MGGVVLTCMFQPRMMNAQTIFPDLTCIYFSFCSPSYAFSYCFLSDGVPRKLRMGSHLRRRVIIFRYKIDPFLKCVSLYSLFVFTYTREQANENLSTIRSIKKQTHTNKNATSISIPFLDVKQITIIGFFVVVVFSHSSISESDHWVYFIFRFIFSLTCYKAYTFLIFNIDLMFCAFNITQLA